MPARLLRGTEEWALSLNGECSTRTLPRHPLLEPESNAGVTPVNLYIFSMRNLRTFGIGPGINYKEALWRYAAHLATGTIESQRAPVWLNLRCDLDSAMVRTLGRRLIRYPTKTASFELGDRTRVVSHEGSLNVVLRPTSQMPSEATSRRMFTLLDGRAYEIPWGDDVPERVERVDFDVEHDGLGELVFGAPVRWTTGHRVHNRAHECGFAQDATKIAAAVPDKRL